MTLPSGSRLLVFQEYREHSKFQIARDLAQTLKIEYFSDAASVILDKQYPIQVILLPEEDLPAWSKREFPVDCAVGVILLESTEGQLAPDPESNQVLAWINPKTISGRRWNYVIRQSFIRLERKRQRSAMQGKIERHNQQFNELNEIGMSLSSEKDLKKLLNLVVSKSMSLTRADGASLYLLKSLPETIDDPDDMLANKNLKLQVALNFSRDIDYQKDLSLEITKNCICSIKSFKL